MFEGFTEEQVKGDGTQIFVRRKGPASAPALVMLHGYPQTSAMWHLMAPKLAERFQVVCLDLRGYGRSDKPASDPEHKTYSKRAMALDVVAVMENLGHQKFWVCAHDRGGRVAHRLGLDHPERVHAMTILDIAPTREMYDGTDKAFAAAYWHWFFLIQPAPIPEDIIGRDPDLFWKHKCYNQAGYGAVFAPDALEEYLRCHQDPASIHAIMCEDYRAAASIDLRHDREDQDGEDQGKKLSMPIQTLWSDQGVIEKNFDALKLWGLRAHSVEGRSLPGSHYFAEQIPDRISQEMLSFFERSGLKF